ncbi:MAG: outer membrane protein OmpA-like peptidoglycan-associated protein [Oceanospirillaceae bacterium]|jgi:outer membrane protein OmpA-like peptidoglycan-associated protein
MVLNRNQLNTIPQSLVNISALGNKQSQRNFKMNTTSTLAVAITLAIISVPAIASSNSEVWTTSNGSAVVDSSGNPIRTIHYREKNATAITPAPQESVSVIKAVEQAVVIAPAKQEPKIIVEQVAQLEVEASQVVAKKVVVEKKVVAENKVVASETTEPQVITPKVEYAFNTYETRVLFDTASATLSADASGSLTQFVIATGLAQSIISVQVVGHADTRGDQAYNMTLSEQRMHSVANFLDGLKLKVSSMFAKGETSPVLDDNGEDLGKSRRVYVAIKTRQLKD